MLMRSPVHPSLMRWMLRPEPAGPRRVAAAYLDAAAGVATFLIVVRITVLVTDHCQRDPITGAACLAGYFRGVGLAIIGGLLVTVGLAIFLKLGLRFAIGLLGLAAPVLLIGQLLSLAGAPWPYALIALAAVPALAAWLTARLFPTPDPARGQIIPHFDGVSWRVDPSQVRTRTGGTGSGDRLVADTPHK